MKKRYWISWYDFASSKYAPNASFTFWPTGSGRRAGKAYQTYAAAIDAHSEADAWQRVGRHFRRYEQRFIKQVAFNWVPMGGVITGEFRT